MKKVVVNFLSKKVTEDNQWARQYAGLDADLVKEYPHQDWADRTHSPIDGKASWAAAVKGIGEGARIAGEGGSVLLLSGHSGSACTVGDITDPRCRFPNEGVCTLDIDSLVMFTHKTVFYKKRFSGEPLSREEKDESLIWRKNMPAELVVPPLERDWESTAAGRKKIRGYYDEIGRALRSNKVARFVFGSCNLGNSPGLVDQIAKDWGTEVGVFKFLTTVVPGNNLPDRKARFTLGRDKASPGIGTNVAMARFDTPSLLDEYIAFIGKP
jgi:hypothetical protein